MNPRLVARIAVLVALAALRAHPADAARSLPMPRSIQLEHKLEIPESGEAELHWQLEIPLENLVFQRRSEGYVAEIRFAVRAERRGDGRIENALWHARLEKPSFTASREGEAFLERYRMPLGPGKWRIEALLYLRGPSAPWSKSMQVEVPEPEDGRFFLQGPRWSGESSFSPPFSIGDPWALGSDDAGFADGLSGKIALECDVLFWQEPSSPLELVLSLEDRLGALKHYARREFLPLSGRNKLRWELPVAQLEMGPHRLRLDVASGEERQRIDARLDVGLTAAAFDRNWPLTVELVQAVAEDDELADLRDALPGERLPAWRDFWDRRDLNGDLPGNETRDIHFQRIDEVCERFNNSFRAGYLSDRGRIFLELGPPEQVERVQDDRNFGLIEYWHYTRLNLIYVFEDRHGYDDFVLVRVMS